MEEEKVIIFSEDLEVKSLDDLAKLNKYLESVNMKPNYCEIARQLGCDRRTVKRYYEEGPSKKTRNRASILDEYYDTIHKQLLDESSPRIFYSKASLYKKLKRDFNLECSESTFRRYISKKPEFQEYFDKNKSKSRKSPTVRFETDPGEQAQLDWKENISFKLTNGETVTVNILVMILSYSRLKLYALTTTKKQDVLISKLVEFFEKIEGIPRTILVDNLKTIMKTPRSKNSPGEVNSKFQQFADDMGFEVTPCMANSPQTKGKVESCMKPLNDIHAYQGELDFEELNELVKKINIEVNMDIHSTTGYVPLALFEKEKETLLPLPRKAIRSLYKLPQGSLKASKDSLVSYQGKQYSVPKEYVNKHLDYQVLEDTLHLYDNTKLVCSHVISKKKINYHEDHYRQYLKGSLSSTKDIEAKTKENLKKLGGLSDR